MDNEYQQLKARVEGICLTLNKFCDAYGELLKASQQNAANIISFNEYCQYLQAKPANIKYELMDPKNDDNSYFYPEFRNDEESIRLVVEQGKSLARFGDGELAIA